MRLKFFKIAPSPSADDIALIEDEIGLKLPNDYLEFLKHYQGGIPQANICASNDICGISNFLTLDQVVEYCFMISDRYDGNYLPFAYAEGGNYVCFLPCEKEKHWPVYFLDHETHEAIKLTDSLHQFINSLLPIDTESISPSPEDIHKTWIAPDFLKRIKGNK